MRATLAVAAFAAAWVAHAAPPSRFSRKIDTHALEKVSRRCCHVGCLRFLPAAPISRPFVAGLAIEDGKSAVGMLKLAVSERATDATADCVVD
jgi:hypothetical protein